MEKDKKVIKEDVIIPSSKKDDKELLPKPKPAKPTNGKRIILHG